MFIVLMAGTPAGAAPAAILAATAAQAPVKPSEPDEIEPVPGRTFVPPAARPDPEAARDRQSAPKADRPAAGAAEVTLPAAQARSTTPAGVRAGSLPVWVASTGEPGPARVKVEVLDRAAASGMSLSVRRTDGRAERGPVTVTVDYSAFKDAYGGDWASRLRLTPASGDATSVTAVRNDLKAATVTAEVSVGAAASTLALTAAASGPKGDYKATSLAPSSLWQVSAHSGDFSWSYPLRTPPVPGELAPPLALSYSSGAVDGHTVATNNQPSWAGEGWNLAPGFVERSYKGCADDLGGNNGQTKTGDLCWETQNAVLSFGEQSGRLVFENNVWRPEDDDGTRVEHLSGGVNGDDDGEYWKVTTTDGTQYFFGLNRLPGWADGRATTQSAWTVPVFGNDAGEPCNKATFATSACQQAYRWNLDYVVDAHGNSMSYFYNQETNRYAQNLGAATGTYVRGGTLARVEYGTRAGAEYTTQAPARVVFETADRCVPGQNCATHTSTSWPDVPWDTDCASIPCGDRYSPTFWSTQRLAKITTQVSAGGGNYRGVDQWELSHTYPPADDGTGDKALWLNAVTQTGLATGTAIKQPAVTFDGTMMANRVNSATDGLPALNKPRITTITTESGGAVNVSYAPPDCAPGALPAAPESNTKRCFPQRWAMPPATTPVNDWFHRYVVAKVVEDDLVTDAKDVVTSFGYDTVKGAAWAYNDNPLVPENQRSWSEWRGYEKVMVRKGDPANDENKAESKTSYLYFRGMHGDRLNAAGGTKTVDVADSTGAKVADAEPLKGFVREQITYDGANEVTGEINDPWTRLTATQGALQAYQVEVATTVTRERYTNGGYRTQRVETAYDQYGNQTKVNDLGDVASAGDDQCTTTMYAHNQTLMLAEFPSRTTTVGVACDATPSYPADAISDTRLSYDGQEFGKAPLRGDVTKTEEAESYSGGTPAYLVDGTSAYDAYGRVTETRDALLQPTTTAYTEVNGLTTETRTTNALGHTVTATLDPAWGHVRQEKDADGRITSSTYDALGRLLKVYKPGRTEAEGQSPHVRFEYGVSRGVPNWVLTSTLRPNGNHAATYTLYDGFLRPRQTQEPSPAGGRILTDTLYDSRGLVSVKRAAYHDTDAPGKALFQPDAGAVPAATVTTYDGAERLTKEIFLKLNTEQWRTTTSYSANWVSVIPPEGGTATTKWIDARDRMTALVQYHGRTLTGPSDVTRYGYTKGGDLAKIIDAAGNVWRYTYDVLGRKTKAEDPDKGVSTMTYDDEDRLLTSTDARGKTVASVHDKLGRVVETHLGSATGPLLTKSVYDTLDKGALTSSTRYVDGQPYVNEVTGYDEAGRPEATSVTIPQVEKQLAGTYTTTTTYAADGSPATRTLPKLGDLGQETLTYGYDDLGRPDTVSGALTYVTDTEYNELGELAQRELGADGKRLWRTIYYEEGTRRVTESLTEREQADGIMVNDLTYAYDPTGNVKRITDRTAGQVKDTQCFTVDYLRRITEAWTQSTDTCAAAPSATQIGGPAPYWHQYAYDLTGNRRTKTVKGVAGAADKVTSYAYPAPGDGVARPHAVTGTTTGQANAAYAYDAAGNTTTRPGATGAQTLAWDDEGLLASITAAGRTTSYLYDTEGRQLIRRDPGAVTLFAGSGELRLDTATGSTKGTRYYEDLGTRTRDGFAWTVADHHGTSLTAIDATTLATTSRRLDLFGASRGTVSQWPAGNRGFVGGTANEETELTRLGAREYDPEAGRFLSVDPVIDPFDPQQMNAYAYADNNPATMSDPDGLKYFEGDSGRWYSNQAAVKNAAKPKKAIKKLKKPKVPMRKPKRPSRKMPDKRGPAKRPISIAHMKDFGARCEGGKNYCDNLGAVVAARSRAKQHDWNGAGGPRGHVGGAPTGVVVENRGPFVRRETTYVEGMLVLESIYFRHPLARYDQWRLRYEWDAVNHTIYNPGGVRNVAFGSWKEALTCIGGVAVAVGSTLTAAVSVAAVPATGGASAVAAVGSVTAAAGGIAVAAGSC
ncbi:RHS repeat-associated core domain-containing protein [Streptosporangium sandarakinum]